MSTNTTKKKTTREKRSFPAKEKCEAVLSVWAERRKPSEVCRELGIKWASLNAWQNQSLAAMLSALAPKGDKDQERGPALGPKLERLLEKTEQRVNRFSKLEKRLEKIQESGQKATSRT